MKPFLEAVGFADDLQAAYDFYKGYSPAVAGGFLSAYDRAISILQQSPFVCHQRRHGWRQMIIHGYPSYSIFYRETEEFWLLGGLMCTLQDPDMVQARLLIREVGEGGLS